MNKQLRKYYWALLLLVSSCLYTGCSKQLEEAPAPTVRVSAVDQQVKREDIRQLKKLFLDKKYNEKLVQKFSDTLYIYWTPQWNKASQKGTPKSITYTYVPLEPKLRVSPYTMGMVGVKEFLLIKRENGQIDFSVATYMYTEPRNKRAVSPYDPRFFTTFTGVLTLNNLATNEGARFIYTNGVTPQTTTKKSATSSTVNSSNPTAADGISNEIICEEYVICYWTASCAFGPNGRVGAFTAGTTTSGLGGCEYPGQEPCYEWGSTWYPNGSTTRQQCHQEDPPPPPDSPPTDGGGGDDGDDAAYEAQLGEELKSNKLALLGNCPELLDKWKYQINLVVL